MSKCALCGGDDGYYPLFKNDPDKSFLCEGCHADTNRLFSLAEQEDWAAFETYEREFKEDYGDTSVVNRILEAAENVTPSQERQSYMFGAVLPARSVRPAKDTDVADRRPTGENVSGFFEKQKNIFFNDHPAKAKKVFRILFYILSVCSVLAGVVLFIVFAVQGFADDADYFLTAFACLLGGFISPFVLWFVGAIPYAILEIADNTSQNDPEPKR